MLVNHLTTAGLLQSCQYTTVECRNTGCGEQVFLNKLEHHLKSECLSRVVRCKDCGKELILKDLQACTLIHISLTKYI